MPSLQNRACRSHAVERGELRGELSALLQALAHRGINAVIVGNYLTTLGRPATADLDMLRDLQMPLKGLSSTL